MNYIGTNMEDSRPIPDTKHFCLTLSEDLICPETDEDIAVFQAWCIEVAETGIMPTHNHLKQRLGSPWSDMCGESIGCRLSFSAWTGDLKEPGCSEQLKPYPC